jgi:uncharacterized membrane protein
LLPAGSDIVLVEAIAISPDGQFVVFDAVSTTTGLWNSVVAQVNPSGLNPISIAEAADPAAPAFESLAADIQHDGTTVRVVGYYINHGSDHAHGFLWQWQKDPAVPAVITDLENSARCHPEAVNSSREVIGFGAIDPSGNTQAFFWNAFGQRQQIPTLGGTRSHASSINDAGYVTGWTRRSTRQTTTCAYLWHVNTGIRDLNLLKRSGDTSGIELTNAVKINNAGQILSRGIRKSVSVDALLTPVQAP